MRTATTLIRLGGCGFQADLSLHCAHRSLCWFCHAVCGSIIDDGQAISPKGCTYKYCQNLGKGQSVKLPKDIGSRRVCKIFNSMARVESTLF